VREVAGEPNDAQVLSTERSEGAAVVVELSWIDSRHQQAALRMHFSADRRWVERSIGFARSDADAERGRTLGFAIASILPQVPSAAASDAGAPGPPAATMPPPEATREQSPAPTAATGPQVLKPAESVPSPASPEPVHPAPNVIARTKRSDFAIDVLALGATGIGADASNASGLGGAAALQWFFARPFALRLGAGLRGGDVASAQASMLTVLECGGVVFHPWRSSLAQRFGASIRAEYLLVEESATHFPSGGAPSKTLGSVVSGLGVTAGASWRVAPEVELVGGAGMEEVFAPVYVEVQHVRLATIPPLRVLAEVGLRLDF
jgi:hypothetical protein